ncbi:MAG: 1-deoxy-D-xylulose-5-phosphate reductoisomerase [Bacteroidales bacterium]
MSKKKIAILGSTGSIGTQTLDIIRRNPDKFEVSLLTANTNSKLLIEQAKEFEPNTVVICDSNHYDKVQAGLSKTFVKVFTGIESVCEIVENSDEIDVVLAAMVGFAGVEPVISAIRGRKIIALANKETLVAAGSVIMKLAAQYHVPILPVDSEHSAIFQSIQGCQEKTEIEKILLTASGGPFLYKTTEEIKMAKLTAVLNHPNWNMGAKVTIDSASMMNKGFEMIEASLLFQMNPSDIQIIIHPQSIIHSMVQYRDGAIIAQLGIPDMRIPIQYALTYPNRIDLDLPRLDFFKLKQLDFIEPDRRKFPCIDIAYHAAQEGGNIPCIMNAANEIAVQAVYKEKIPFYKIPDIIEKVINKSSLIKDPSMEDIKTSNKEGRLFASEIIEKL